MVIDFKNGIHGDNLCDVKIVDGLLTAEKAVVENVTFPDRFLCLLQLMCKTPLQARIQLRSE